VTEATSPLPPTLPRTLPRTPPRRIWWPWDRPAARVALRRRFAVNRQAVAILYLSASGPYRAWLDGAEQIVPDGPLPSWRSMHRLGMALTAGEHWLCIEAEPGEPPPADRRSFDTAGNGAAGTPGNQPFVLACLDWDEAGTPRRVPTDASWEMAAEPPSGWAAANGPRVAGWQPAWAFDGVWAEPWGMPCNAPDDFCALGTGWQRMTQEPLVRVARLHPGLVSAGGRVSVEPDGSATFHPVGPFPAAPPSLDARRPRLEWYRTREAHSLINNTWLDLFEPRAPHVVFDAGAETFGRLVVRVRKGGPAIVAITTGESLGEVQRYARRVTDIVELRNWETFTTAPAGFRYAKVMVLSAARGLASVVLDPVQVQHIRYDAEIAGSFACSDPTLDAVWQLSARTLHLCMQNEVWDGVKRDQLPWMGDLYTEALAAYHVLGDASGDSGEAGRLVRRTLAVLAEVGPQPARPSLPQEQRYPGLAALWRTPVSPGNAGHDINGIPSYTMWWIVGLADYLRYTGDVGLVWEVAAELRAALDHIAACVDADGLWRLAGGWDFVDWSPLPEAERRVFCHLLATQVMALGARLVDASGRNGDGYRRLHRRMVEAGRREWWREGAGQFGTTHHVNAMAIRSGILNPAEAADLFKRTLAPDPSLSMTYWHRYADLAAAESVGQVQWGLDYIRKHWGSALQVGMSTLWEAFDPAWLGDDPHAVAMVGAEHARYGGYETSLCHGWSAGPAVWLHTAVLGVRPASPGFAAVDFNPSLGDARSSRGLQWAQGIVPTLRGPVRVSLNRRGAEPVAEISLPPDVELRLPDQPRETWKVRVIQ
jgi:hypothetical protein